MNRMIRASLTLMLMACGDPEDTDQGTDTAIGEDTDYEIERPVYPDPEVAEITLETYGMPYNKAIIMSPSGGHIVLQDTKYKTATAILNLHDGTITEIPSEERYGTLGMSITDDGAEVGGWLVKEEGEMPGLWTAETGWQALEGEPISGCGSSSIFAGDGIGMDWGGLSVNTSCEYRPAIWTNGQVDRWGTKVGRINAMLPGGPYFGFYEGGGITSRSPAVFTRSRDIELIAGSQSGEFSAVHSDGTAIGVVYADGDKPGGAFTWSRAEGMHMHGFWPLHDKDGNLTDNPDEAVDAAWSMNVMDICRPDMFVGFSMSPEYPPQQVPFINFQGQFQEFDDFLADQGIDTRGNATISINTCSESGNVIGGTVLAEDGMELAFVLQFPADFWENTTLNQPQAPEE